MLTDQQRAFLDALRVARLATADAAGRPHVVPICYLLRGDSVYFTIDEKPKRKAGANLKRLANLRENPRAALLVDHYDEDWSRLWWVRLRGRARVLDEGEERERALALLAEKYPQYRTEPPDGPVLAVDVTERREWAGEANP
jgi:PPOX class probable F420-dependent enzyme